MKPSKKKYKYPLTSKLECRKRRAQRHAKQMTQEHQAQREMAEETYRVQH